MTMQGSLDLTPYLLENGNVQSHAWPGGYHHAELTAVRWLLSRLIARYNTGDRAITLDDLHRLEADLVQMQSEMVSL